jgi:NAD(P)-dependent dehydrogenase (short-subunit alcohol dehydrogenase family)
MKSIKGAAAFVTGGASGIGLGIARALMERGAKVAIADVREDHLAEAVAQAPGLLPLRLDVTDRAAFAGAIAEAEAALGPLRILVNNAGVGIEGPVDQAGFADWDWGVGVNLIGVANGLVVGLPRIAAHGLGGHVVNTASLGALMQARRTRGIYATTKAGIVALSEHLLLELEGSGIGVSVLCPGPVKTNIRESGRTRPEHLKEGSRFLDYENALAERPDGPMWLDPLVVGHMVVEAILSERLYIITHPEFIASVKARHAAIEAAMGG